MKLFPGLCKNINFCCIFDAMRPLSRFGTSDKRYRWCSNSQHHLDFSYQTLRLRIDDALREKRGLERIIEREAEDDEKIARLTDELNSVRETRAIEVGKRKKKGFFFSTRNHFRKLVFALLNVPAVPVLSLCLVNIVNQT